MEKKRSYNDVYEGEHLSRVAFPLGGIGAGMICLEGAGALSHVSIRNQPDIFNEPLMFSALCAKGEPPSRPSRKGGAPTSALPQGGSSHPGPPPEGEGGNVARVLEGPVPSWKVFFPWGRGAGNGASGKDFGLPRCSQAAFEAQFPFGKVTLEDPDVPLDMEIVGWSPFVPGDADSSSLPVAALEYRFVNTSRELVEAVYSFHARNFMSTDAPGEMVRSAPGGFVLWQPGSDEAPWEQGAFSAAVDDVDVRVNCAWFRGGWFDPLTMVWKSVRDGAAPEAEPVTEGGPSLGGSLYVPFRLEPGQEKVIQLRLAWHVPETDLRIGKDPGRADSSEAEAPQDASCSGSSCGSGAGPGLPTHRPWYADIFDDIEAVTGYWRERYDALREASAAFSDCFYDTTLPPEVVEAVAANLTILKSPTLLRQADGRLWCWEGCCDDVGCCHGSCTHVWNYAQALPHLFPSLERSLRQTEFNDSQDERGHQVFRTNLPIRPTVHDFHAAADGQLGGIMQVYREWRISGDTDWLRRLWPKVKRSLAYCIETWDPDHRGVLVEPHHNTYDIEFWGPDGMCTSFYLGALRAAVVMADAVGEDALPQRELYAQLLEKGRATMEAELWNGEYFIQRIQWQGLHAGDPTQALAMHTDYSPEAQALLKEEGPKYQYGRGCLSDGVVGAWLAACCGVGELLDREMVASHLLAVHKYNHRKDLSDHANPQRPTFALGDEGGLLLCTWPRGGELSLPFVYSDEVWTGIEYQVASHLMMLGHVDEGLEIVRTARDRYDGRVRNPFNEYECGHWYARALASYALLQGLTGARYDAVEKKLTIKPSIQGDFRAFLCTATGYGTVGVRGWSSSHGQPFVEVKHGVIPYEELVYEPC